MKQIRNKASEMLSRREFIAASGLGTAAILVNGLPALAGTLSVDMIGPATDKVDGKTTWAPVHISLDGKWKLYYFPQGKHGISGPGQLKSTGLKAIDATVPGDAPLELSRIGELPADLVYGDNITKLRPYELYEWWYQREFPTPKETAGRQVELRFHGVDCFATYWLNGTRIGDSDNALIEHSFDVTDKLSPGAMNILTVRLRSPEIEAARQNYDPAFTEALETNQEGTWIRKPAHCWGWNIMPRAVSSGLWRSVELIVHTTHEIRDLYFATAAIGQDSANLAVSFDIQTDLALLPQLQLKIQGEGRGATFSHLHKLQFIAGRMEFSIEKPMLWWPRGYGDASLYTVTTQLICGEEVLASRVDTIGIRQIELIRTEITSPEKPGEFLFKVNGVPILVKGANWVPADTFHSRDREKYQQKLALFADVECNMLRSWGGGVYEDHEFFSICDRSGIMVWQDFAMACAIYPITPEFQEIIRQEAIAVIRKLRNHPSIALWSGDNEDDEAYGWMGLDPAHNTLTRQVLPQVVFQCDPYRPFLPSSPYRAPEVVATNNRHMMPEEHLWNTRDYFKTSYYTDHTAHFVSEIGFDGCPGVSGLKRFLDDQHLWPWQNNSQWILHSTSNTGDDYENHVLAKEAREFYADPLDKMENFIFASQTMQAEAYKYIIEMTRLKKWRRTGIIWWNMIDGWPLLNDSVVDYYFNKKLSYYYIRRVQQQVCLMVDEPQGWYSRVVMGNDSRQDASGHYRIWDADSDETLLEGDYATKANENVEIGKIAVFHSDRKLFLMQWTVAGKRYVNHYLLGAPPFSLLQYRAWLPKIAALGNDFDASKVGE